MGGGFACPECGESIVLPGLTPGREVICPTCSTLVEVPYLPRATRRPGLRFLLPGASRGQRRSRRGWMEALRSHRRLQWGVAFGLVGLVALATWSAVGSIESKTRADRERILAELVAASDAASKLGDAGTAFREIEAAVSLARRFDPAGSSRLESLVEHRDHAARVEVLNRLAQLKQLGPDAAAGEAEILADRARRDPALGAIADPIAAAVETTATQRAEGERDRAQAAFQANRGSEAFRLASRAVDHARRLASRVDQDRIEAEARAIMVAVVERFGATIATGPSVAPTPADNFADSLWLDAVANHGYLLPPPRSPWSDLWTEHAPYQVSAQVVETHEGLYLQSQNRPTQINGQFAVINKGREVWQTRVFAQTRAPLLDLPAYLAGRLATANHRDAEVERRLRDDARTAFRILADRNFRGIPTPGPPAAEPAAASPPNSVP